MNPDSKSIQLETELDNKTEAAELTLEFYKLYKHILAAAEAAQALRPLVDALANREYGNAYNQYRTKTELRLLKETQDNLTVNLYALSDDLTEIKRHTDRRKGE